MVKMIGSRVKELEILSNACEQNESKLIAVYSRRRIGKTYLLNHMFSERGTNSALKVEVGSHFYE